MSTPQGPNGSDQGKSARKPEDRNGREVETDPSGPAAEKQPKPAGDAVKPSAAQSGKPVEKPASESENQPIQKSAVSSESVANAGKGDPAPAEEQATRPVQRSNPTRVRRVRHRRGSVGQQPTADKQGSAPQQNTPQTNLPGVGPGLGKAVNRPSGTSQRPATGPQPL